MERLKAWRKDWWKRLTASALFLTLLPVLVTHASVVPPVDPDAKAVANEYYWREKLAGSVASR